MGMHTSRDSFIQLVNDGAIEPTAENNPSNNARIERLILEIDEAEEVLLEAKRTLEKRPEKTSRILSYFGAFSLAVATHLTGYLVKIIAMIASLLK
jgi:hypothetical protein